MCKPCASDFGKKWHKDNPEKVKINRDAYVLKNKVAYLAYHKEWRLRNANRIKGQSAEWSRNNLDKKKAATARRRASKLSATPSWANLKGISRFYELAHRLTVETGIQANVDHIVPLKSKFVCGLHCEANLSIMTAKHNKQKGNLWWPHMPGRDEELDA